LQLGPLGGVQPGDPALPRVGGQLHPLARPGGVEGLQVDVAGTLLVRPSRPLTKVDVERIGVGGVQLGGVETDLTDPSQPRARWTPDEEVLKLKVVGTDAAGLSGFLELSPWSYEVPHEDVVFASGSHALDPAELPKLEQAWRDVQAVLAKYGDVVTIQLFVAGFTDTVGAAASNEGLSQRRAQTIARWFRERGFTGAVHHQGFGERVLAVATPDETDEAANRRAVYILAAEVPPVSEGLPAQAWTRVP
jgi:outer membrane protein OmpA-like peptidoglycan-associated protein